MKLHEIGRLLSFDQKDRELIGIVNDVLAREDYSGLRRLLTPYLHPRGIKEMAAPTGLRIAYAVVNLLGSLELGKAQDRIDALRSVRAEVMRASRGGLTHNTARVLLQIMKEIVRGRDNPEKQLKLAHDFQRVATGKPRIVRRELRKYHLIEMPEEWNHLSFDDHVHDANTKGRKSATHLIMDAWIKGIRRLTVIYYNYVQPEVAAELLEAGDIMGITVRVGIEYHVRFRGRRAKVIWVPRGFDDPRDFLTYLAKPRVSRFMSEGLNLSREQQAHVARVLEEFNLKLRKEINEVYTIDLPPLSESDFMRFVGSGQASLVHLGKFIHERMLPLMASRVEELREAYEIASPDGKSELRELLEALNMLDADTLIEDYLEPLSEILNEESFLVMENPGLAAYSAPELISRILEIRTGNRIILNLCDLSPADVVELLYDCGGQVTHLEIFNLKNEVSNSTFGSHRIVQLYKAINSKNVITLKKCISDILEDIDGDKYLASPEARDKIQTLSNNAYSLLSLYKNSELRLSIGSDSTGRSSRVHGMGMVVIDTLPLRSQAELLKSLNQIQKTVPVGAITVLENIYSMEESYTPFFRPLYNLCRNTPGLRYLFLKRSQQWRYNGFYSAVSGDSNIHSLGGLQGGYGNEFCLEAKKARKERDSFSFKYINSFLRNSFKILLGFLPAMLAFGLTKDWWLLKYFGAFIWFGITGLRNIIQSVLGSGGWQRSPLLKWKDYISWDRFSDSLLFTGFSVPLLDYFVKTLLLQDTLGLTVGNNTVAVYMSMALVNGCYVSGHNLFRGLPRKAVYGNFFRSAFSIPLALLYNFIIAYVLSLFGVSEVQAILQQWAAVISKLASDCVAAIIEGMADRDSNIRLRLRDYRDKFKQMLKVYAQLETLFPHEDTRELLVSPKALLQTLSKEKQALAKVIIVNALDLLYFWMYQPRARSVLIMYLNELSPEEREVLLLSQSVLLRQKEISQLILDGLVGKNFSFALAFYLDYSRDYLEKLGKVARRFQIDTAGSGI